MQTPLTPLEFALRARKLYGDREAVVDGNLRLTYEQFFDRCDRWSATLQAFGIAPGDRIAYIAPNTHAQLESFYAVPQIGAVLVPINYRLTPDDFAYLINHSGARIVCAHSTIWPRLIICVGDCPRLNNSSPLRARTAAGSSTKCCCQRRRPNLGGLKSMKMICSRLITPAAPPRARKV